MHTLPEGTWKWCCPRSHHPTHNSQTSKTGEGSAHLPGSQTPLAKETLTLPKETNKHLAWSGVRETRTLPEHSGEVCEQLTPPEGVRHGYCHRSPHPTVNSRTFDPVGVTHTSPHDLHMEEHEGCPHAARRSQFEFGAERAAESLMCVASLSLVS